MKPDTGQTPTDNPLVIHDLKFCRDQEWLIGVDEAGRGAFAGPVVAGAVAVNSTFLTDTWVNSGMGSLVNDSKKLSESDRENLYDHFTLETTGRFIFWASGSAGVEEIERVNILGATKLAMARALESLKEKSSGEITLPETEAGKGRSGDGKLQNLMPGNRSPEKSITAILVDGKPLASFPYCHQALVQGDGRSWSIGLASIIAKVTRDRFMRALSRQMPEYHFEENKGYGTPRHKAAILSHGISRWHRPTFLRKLQAGQDAPIQSHFDF